MDTVDIEHSSQSGALRLQEGVFRSLREGLREETR